MSAAASTKKRGSFPVALRLPRLQASAPSGKNAPSPVRVAPRPPVMPAMQSAKPRDAALQDRLKQVAASAAEKKATADNTDCKRRARRKSTALPGLITFTTMRLQVPCTIADMSGTGARLVLPASTAQTFGDLEHLPEKLVLVMRADRMQVDCEIKWRRPGSLGVRFLGPPVPLQKPKR